MRRSILFIALLAAAAVFLWAQLLWAQQRSSLPQYEVKSILPRETSPAQYQQVEPRELEMAADQGWELVSVMPYVYKNEERGTPAMSPRPMVTQTYPAYFFKRAKPAR
jgi:hypothetical protein